MLSYNQRKVMILSKIVKYNLFIFFRLPFNHPVYLKSVIALSNRQQYVTHLVKCLNNDLLFLIFKKKKSF